MLPVACACAQPSAAPYLRAVPVCQSLWYIHHQPEGLNIKDFVSQLKGVVRWSAYVSTARPEPADADGMRRSSHAHVLLFLHFHPVFRSTSAAATPSASALPSPPLARNSARRTQSTPPLNKSLEQTPVIALACHLLHALS